MGKLEENKKKKKDAIVNAAFSLFIQNGINDTSIADIMKEAGLAKGTFYLYFKDKYEVRDYLIRTKASQIFEIAQLALENTEIEGVENQIIFLVDNILNQMNDNQVLLKFISKNLSWGIFKNAMQHLSVDKGLNIDEFLEKLFAGSEKTYRNPEMLLYMIIELVNSTSHSVILYKQPVELPELKEELYPVIRLIIQSFEL